MVPFTPSRHRAALVVAASTAITLAAPLPSSPGLAATEAPPSVRSVERVDLQRYAGFWYEIAKVPNPFQRQCARDTLARYTLLDQGRVAVLNQCIRRSGRVEQAAGVARVVDRTSQARLKVSLVSFLGWRPFWGDYWIIGLDADYRWAIVGAPNRRYGWILARTRSLDATTLEQIGSVLEANGYSRSAFVTTPQTP
jgi:apolipoprotein D and lipocalin family protein